jgi:hypothetical protein
MRHSNSELICLPWRLTARRAISSRERFTTQQTVANIQQGLKEGPAGKPNFAVIFKSVSHLGYSHYYILIYGVTSQRHEEETARVVCRLAAIVSVTAVRNQYGVQYEQLLLVVPVK